MPEATTPCATQTPRQAIGDPALPRVHFVPPAGWINDPNGLTWWRGRYHLFYQHNPDAPVHHRIRWGHAASVDLLHWEDLPLALEPSPGPDEDGCYSGVFLDVGGTPALLYSGHAPRRQPTEVGCLAVGSQDLARWTKADRPVLLPPADPAPRHMRDHCVWAHEGTWHQLVGACLEPGSGAVLHYTATDVHRWEFRGVLLRHEDLPGGGVGVGTMWECPDLIREPGSDRAALVFSAWDEGRTLHTVQVPGRSDGRGFTPDGPARLLDLGRRHYYAPQSLRIPDGRTIQLGWVQEDRDQASIERSGWSGALSLPRELTFGEDGTLRAAPLRELETLRGPVRAARRDAAGTGLVPGLSGTFEAEAELTLDRPGDEAVVRVGDHPGPDPVLGLRFTRTGDGIRVERHPDRHHAGDPGDVLPCGPGALEVRIVVDGSVAEVFLDGRALTLRMDPVSPGAAAVSLSAVEAGAHLGRLRAWDLRPVWT
ncbi:MAG: glycoside hydrolase family 32 protein [Actinomyces sp.]|nr:glycoside hydrolase family 32 protein [Actinomyces sp.]MCI1830279.1 glycoside hydrolase family 32 protein [Actinomyces sp.]MCI1867051.1 glycoside hydrolase family 32 protein [Actinomyces sp.]